MNRRLVTLMYCLCLVLAFGSPSAHAIGCNPRPHAESNTMSWLVLIEETLLSGLSQN